MILRNILFILFILGVYNFAQAQTPVLIGGGGICYTNGNPNSITALNSQNLGGDCFIAVDTVAELVYVYDESLGVGERWTILKTDVTVGDKGEIYVYSPTNWMLDTISKIRFNTTLNGTILDTVGHLKWNSNDGTLNLGMGFGGVVYQMGEELFYPTVINKSGSIIYNGQLVMVDPTTGVQGDRIRVVRAITNGTYPSDLVMGVATMDIPIDGEGYITYFGYVREVVESNIAQTGVNLSVGDILYPSATEAGKFTNVAPTPPANNTPIAFVVRKPSVNNLTLLVRYNKSQKLSELDDVILTTPADNSFLYYKASDGLWRDTLISNIVTGTGTNNQLAYFTGTTTLGSLSTITYPSLTEISYVKGVTSSIQNQLNSKLGTTLNSANIFVGNVSNVATGVALSGDATISNAGALTIANNAVSNAKFRQSALLSVVGNSTNATANVADITAASDHQVLRRSGTSLGFGAINLAQSNAVTDILGVANGGTGTSTAFTTGSIVFAGASGVYSQNNANLFWNNTSNSLGIGTNSPQRNLHVNGRARITNLAISEIPQTRILSADDNGDIAGLKLGAGFSISNDTLKYISTSGLTGSGTTNEIAYFNTSSTLASLSTATYPSLTELAYVKGVTSAIQTQLNGKLGTSLTSTNIFVGNASNVATGVALSGDATISNTGVLTIGNNVISNAKIRQSGALSVIGNSGAITGNVNDIVATLDHQVLRRNGSVLGFGAINLAQSNAVTGILGVANGGTGTSTALTTGSVVFAGASGVYSQDNANLFWDDNNNRLGIGTASPRAPLEIFGDQIVSASNVWTSRTLGALTRSWSSITYGNGLFVAVASTGTGNRIATSPDGINWTSIATPEGNLNEWTSVTYGNGLFVAVSTSGANRVMTSPDGVTWTARTSPINSWLSVTYGNGTFVAVGWNTGDKVMTSTDGINWTSRTAAAENSWASVTYGNGLFVAVSYSGSGNRVMTSPDGITWTSRTSAANNSWRSVTYGNGYFVAVSSDGASRVMYSINGISWTLSTGGSNVWSSVTYANGVFVAVANGTNTSAIMTSVNVINWASRTAPSTSYRSVVYGNGIFVAVGVSDACMTSGITNENILSLNNQYNGTHSFTQNVIVGANTAPQRTLHVNGEARITDLTTDNPTRIVGADADGDLSAIKLGSGLSFSNDTLSLSRDYAEMYLESSINVGLIAAGTLYKITNFTEGFKTDSFSFGNNNRFTYTGSTTKKFKVIVTVSIEQTSGEEEATIFLQAMENNVIVNKSRQLGMPNGLSNPSLDRVKLYINVTSQCIVELATNDYIEVALSSDNPDVVIKVYNANLIIEEL